MAGSLRAFLYTADDGNQYKIFRDESNTETINAAGDQEDGVPPAGTPTLPSRWETRYALLYQVSNPSIKRKVTIRISALIGERRLGLTNVDTAQNDGDSENTDETDNDDA